MTAPAPGWYPDPHNPAAQRYWDGSQWTSHDRAGGSHGGSTHAPALHKLQGAGIRIQTRLAVDGMRGIASEAAQYAQGGLTFNQLRSWVVRVTGQAPTHIEFGVFGKAAIGSSIAGSPVMTFTVILTAMEWGCAAESNIVDFVATRDVIGIVPMPKQLQGYAGYKSYMTNLQDGVIRYDPGAQVQIIE